MGQTGRYHGGLVFLGSQDAVLDKFSRIVSSTLEDYGHPIERQSVVSAHHARIVTHQYMVKLTLEDQTDLSDQSDRMERLDTAAGLNRRRPTPRVERRQRIEIELCAVADGLEDKDVSELMLVVMLYRMVDAVAAVEIEWLEPDVVLTVDQFLGAFTSVAPRRVSHDKPVEVDSPFAPIEETEAELAMHYDKICGQAPHAGEIGLIDLSDEEALALAFRSDAGPRQINASDKVEQAENDIRRLASWGMTGMLVFLSAPVAASMAAVNLAKGEDFRLNTHVLSLTGFLVFAQSSGALAGAMSYLPL